MTRGGGHLDEAGQHAALGRVVQGVDGCGVGRDERGLDDADARVVEQAAGSGQQRGADAPLEPGALLPREDRRPFDGGAAGEQEVVARGQAALGQHARRLGLAEHLADEDRTVEADRDLGMAAAHGGAERIACGGDVGHDGVGQGGGGGGLGQQQDGEEPAGAGAEDRHVVRVDVHGVGANPVGGKRDGVGGDDERAAADLEDGGVLAGLRPDEHLRVVAAQAVHEGGEVGRRELAGGERSRHGLYLTAKPAARGRHRVPAVSARIPSDDRRISASGPSRDGVSGRKHDACGAQGGHQSCAR